MVRNHSCPVVMLVDEILHSAEGLGGPNSRLKLMDEALKARTRILVRFVESKAEKELQALLALQRLMFR